MRQHLILLLVACCWLSSVFPSILAFSPLSQQQRLLHSTITTKLQVSSSTSFLEWQAFAEESLYQKEDETTQQQQQQQLLNYQTIDRPNRLNNNGPPKNNNNNNKDKAKKLQHLACLTGLTFPWYAYSSMVMMAKENVGERMFGVSEGVFDAMAWYVPTSQILVYGLLWKLMNAASLRQGQFAVAGCILCCVPADTIIILFDPTGNKLFTMAAFASVTMCYGILLAHYLRKASNNEIIIENNNNNLELECDLETETEICVAVENQNENDELEDSLWQALVRYRTPNDFQATNMAVSFSRTFVDFTVTLTALNTVLKAGAAFNYALWVTLIVILTSHAAAKMFLTTIFPGIALDRFKDYLLAEVVLYSIQVVASSVFGLHYNLGDSVTDSIANSWLFGNGAAAIVENVEKLTKGIDWDKKLGLEDDDDFFDIGNNNNQDEVGLISSWDD